MKQQALEQQVKDLQKHVMELQAELDKASALHETLADIAYIAGEWEYFSGDSREDINNFIAWAKEFEAMNHDWKNSNLPGCDYINVVTKFAKLKMKDAYALSGKSTFPPLTDNFGK